MEEKTEIMNPLKETPKPDHTTIIRSKSNDIQSVGFKKMFDPKELKSFTERVSYEDMNRKKVTDEKTDVFIDLDDHYKEEDEVNIGYVIDGKYELVELITRKSGEAQIYKCKVKGFSGVYCAKIYYPSIQPKEDIMEKLLSNLNSENVVKLNMIGFILTKTGRRLYEIMPYYSQGNLEMRMPLCEEELIDKIIPSINEGLKAIHRLNIIHRDLKPNNLFIDEIGPDDEKKEGYKLANNEKIVIGDFGISSQIKDGATHRVTSASRTRGYGAPETIRDNITTPKSDYFSFGITLLTLLVGEYPYHDEVEMIIKIKENVWDFPSNISPRMQVLIKGLMDYDRNTRFGYDEVNDWLLNKTIQVQNVKERSFENVESRTPYEFKFKKYYRIVDLVEAMIQDWNFALQHIENRFIDKYYRGISKEFDEVLADMDRLRHVGASNDKIFLTLVYAVLEYDGIIYEDLNFSDIDDMSEYILSSNTCDRRIIKMINNKALYFILTLVNKHGHNIGDMEKLKNIIKRVTAKVKEDQTVGYYLLGYVFNKDKLDIDLVKKGIIDADRPVKSINDVYDSFETVEDKDGYADYLMTNKKFIAWLVYKGYNKNIEI